MCTERLYLAILYATMIYIYTSTLTTQLYIYNIHHTHYLLHHNQLPQISIP